MACEYPTIDLCVLQNATFDTTLQLTDQSGSAIDITSWSFSGSIKESVASPVEVTHFSCSVTSVPNATVRITLTPYQSALLTRKKYVYDIIATNMAVTPLEVYRIIEGQVNVDLGVTDV